MGDFYGTGTEIWAGFGPIVSNEKKRIWADYEQLLRPVFSLFFGKKKKKIEHIIASALKSYIIPILQKIYIYFFLNPEK